MNDDEKLIRDLQTEIDIAREKRPPDMELAAVLKRAKAFVKLNTCTHCEASGAKIG